MNSQRGSYGREVEENTIGYTKTDKQEGQKEGSHFFIVQVPSTSLHLLNHCVPPLLSL